MGMLHLMDSCQNAGIFIGFVEQWLVVTLTYYLCI